MDLVMFRFAIEHVSRIGRVLTLPGGNALLVGTSRYGPFDSHFFGLIPKNT